jgi:hypothetical protein
MDLSGLNEELLILCREWFQNQIGDLDEDDLPSEGEIEDDILDMREEISVRVSPFLESTNALAAGIPNDNGNIEALSELIEKYRGHEANTPIFTKLALSKYGQNQYQGGWPLCTIRVVAEAWLQQSTNA